MHRSGLPPYNGLENLSWDVEDAIPTGIDDWANLPALDEAGAQPGREWSAAGGGQKRRRPEEEQFVGGGGGEEAMGFAPEGMAAASAEPQVKVEQRPNSPVWSTSTPSSSMSGDSEYDEGQIRTPDYMAVETAVLEADLRDELGGAALSPDRARQSRSPVQAPPRQGGQAAFANMPSRRPASSTPTSNTDGSLTIGCDFDLRSKQWRGHSVAALPGFALTLSALPTGPFRSLSAKGRHSREERESERRAQEILRTPGWSIDERTNFEDLECLISALVRWLECATGLISTPLAWCVGGSLDATLRGRDGGGRSHLLRFALCERRDWTGDRKTTKIGNTCRWHAGGLKVHNCVVDGSMREEITLRKCTWMKCCYGRKHYGEPPNIAWCNTCEYQKKLVKKKAEGGAAAAGGGRSVTPTGRQQQPARVPEPCHGCLPRILGLDTEAHGTRGAGSARTCGSCVKLIERADRFVRCLTVAASSQPGAAVAAGGRPLIEPPKAKAVVLRLIASVNLQAQARQVEPILVDALLHRYQATDVESLWATSAAARAALSRLVLDDIGVAYQIHQGLQQQTTQQLQPCPTASFLTALPMPQFLGMWQQAGNPALPGPAPGPR